MTDAERADEPESAEPQESDLGAAVRAWASGGQARAPETASPPSPPSLRSTPPRSEPLRIAERPAPLAPTVPAPAPVPAPVTETPVPVETAAPPPPPSAEAPRTVLPSPAPLGETLAGAVPPSDAAMAGARRRRLTAAAGGAGFDTGIKMVVGLVILGLLIFTAGQFLSAAQSDDPVPSGWEDAGFGDDETDDGVDEGFVDEDFVDEDVDGADESDDDEDLDGWDLGDDEATDDGER